jgi:hypothetical protein
MLTPLWTLQHLCVSDRMLRQQTDRGENRDPSDGLCVRPS